MQNHLSLEIEIFAEELSALSSLLIITFNHETIHFRSKKISFLFFLNLVNGQGLIVFVTVNIIHPRPTVIARWEWIVSIARNRAEVSLLFETRKRALNDTRLNAPVDLWIVVE